MGIIFSSLYEPISQFQNSASCRNNFEDMQNGSTNSIEVQISDWLEITMVDENEDLKKSVDDAVNWINALIKAPPIRNGKNDEYKVRIGVARLEEGVLGSAGGGDIFINSLNDDEYIKLNDQSMKLNTVVLIHEIMHILGLCNIYNTEHETCVTNSKKLLFKHKPYHTGTATTAGYRKVITDCLGTDGEKLVKKMEEIDDELGKQIGVPLEDYWGPGSTYAHEYGGYRPSIPIVEEDNQLEPRYITNNNGEKIRYPSQTLELMAAFINDRNYLTSVTTGMLKDRGFYMNNDDELINSGYVKNIDSFSVIDYDNTNSFFINSRTKRTPPRILGKCAC